MGKMTFKSSRYLGAFAQIHGTVALIRLQFPITSTFSFFLTVLAIRVLPLHYVNENVLSLPLSASLVHRLGDSTVDPSPTKHTRDRCLVLPCLPSPCTPSTFPALSPSVLLFLSSELQGEGESKGSLSHLSFPLHVLSFDLTHLPVTGSVSWQPPGICEMNLILVHSGNHPLGDYLICISIQPPSLTTTPHP